MTIADHDDEKPGLFGLPARSKFEADHQAAPACVVLRPDPDEYPVDTVAECRCWLGDGPSDGQWAERIAVLLQADHEARIAGYDDLAQRLAFAEAHASLAYAAMAYAVDPTVDGLFELRASCSAMLARGGVK